jgi:hypothetical protein
VVSSTFQYGRGSGQVFGDPLGEQEVSPVQEYRKQGKVDVSLKAGGNQIEYEDEDPHILQLFEKRLAKNGVACKMSSVLKTR